MAAFGTQFGIAIASVGVTGTSRLRYFMNGPAPSWDDDGTWVPGAIPWRTFPGQLASSVSFRTQTPASIGGMVFDLRATAPAVSDGKTVAELLYDLQPVKIGDLTVAAAYNTTTLTTSSTALAGKTVIRGLECIQMGTHDGGGVYSGCLRGRWGTRARSHDVGDGDHTALYDATTGPNLLYRRVSFVRVNMSTATSYDDIEVVWTGVIKAIERPKPNALRIQADALLSMLQGRKILIKPWQGTVRPPSDEVVSRGGLGGSTVTVQHRDYQVTGDNPGASRGGSATLLSVDGDAVVQTQVTPRGGGSYGATFTDADIYRVDEMRDPPVPKEAKRAWECHHCGRGIYSGNLATLFLEALSTSREGNNGADDLGSDEQGDEDLGLGLQIGDIDLAGIKEIRARLGDLLIQDRNFFNVEKPDGIDVLKWFSERFWPYGISITQRGGKIGLAFLDDNDLDVDVTLVEGVDILGPASRPEAQPPPHHRRVMDMAFDSVRAEYSYIPGAGTISDTFVDAVRRVTHPYADQSAPLARLDGVARPDQVIAIISALLQRFHDDIGEVTLPIRRTSGDKFEAGTLIRITHSKIPSPAGGGKGVTDEAFLVLSKERADATNVTTIKALDVGGLYGSIGRVAPALVVASYDAGTPAQVVFHLNRGAGGFQSGDWDAYPADDDDIAVGDKLDHCDKHGQVIEEALTVTSIADGVLVFSPAPSTAPTPTVGDTPGDTFRVTRYDNCSARQQERYAYLAGDDGALGASSDPGKEYTAF